LQAASAVGVEVFRLREFKAFERTEGHQTAFRKRLPNTNLAPISIFFSQADFVAGAIKRSQRLMGFLGSTGAADDFAKHAELTNKSVMRNVDLTKPPSA